MSTPSSTSLSVSSRAWASHSPLDQTLAEATHRLKGDYAADIRDYEHIHRHILEMADTLSAGIMAQFPQRFR